MQSRSWIARIIAFFVLTTISWALVGPQACNAGWVDVRVVGPFVVRADFPLAGFDKLLAELPQLQTELQRSLGIRPSNESIEVYLFKNEKTYRAFLARHFPKTPYKPALYDKTDGPGKVLVYRNRDFSVNLRHECTHAILHAALPMVPLWLDEGLAKYYEVPSAQRASGNSYLKDVKFVTRFGLLASIEKLESKDDFSRLSSHDYRDCWAWVHFMLHGPAEARHELIRFLADIQANTPPGTLSWRLARRLPKLRAQMVSHFKTWK